MKILFVCASNICRSPYAELLFKKIVSESPILSANIEDISSTALFNKSKSMHPNTAKALLAEGVSENEIAAFKPDFALLNPSKLKNADVIIGMSPTLKTILPVKYWKKYETLSQAAIGKCLSIPDPWLTKSEEFYFQTMDMIKTFLHVYAEKLEGQFSSKTAD